MVDAVAFGSREYREIIILFIQGISLSLLLLRSHSLPLSWACPKRRDLDQQLAAAFLENVEGPRDGEVGCAAWPDPDWPVMLCVKSSDSLIASPYTSLSFPYNRINGKLSLDCRCTVITLNHS